MARKVARKHKGGRPKGLAQSSATKKKIAAKLKAYWNSAAGKARKVKSKGGKTTARKATTTRKATTARRKAVPKKAWSAPKVTARRGRPKGSKNKTATVRKTTARAPVKKRRASRKGPMT